jgi:hypothetical protein
MEEELSKLIENLGDWDRGKRSGQHWGGGGAVQRQAPRRTAHPWDGIGLGIQDPLVQARLAAEQQILCSPARDLPQLRPQDGNWVAYLYPSGNGRMEFIRGFYYSLGQRLAPDRRMMLLEFNAFAGLEVTVTVPANGEITEHAKRHMSERRRIIASDNRGLYLDAIVTVGGAECREYAVSFAFLPGR